jgi:murein DD-endopeptidase MepM/ murein hydrolase activator NlpD
MALTLDALRKLIKQVFGSAFTVSRGFSASHDGIDIPAKEGTPVRAVASGIVEYARDARVAPDQGASGWAMGGGNVVNIAIGVNRATQYAHLQRFIVSKGQAVKQGQIIGYVGRTGGSNSDGSFGGAGAEFVGAHIHFGLWDHKTNRMVNPVPLLSAIAAGTYRPGKDADDAATGGLLAGWGDRVSLPVGTTITPAIIEQIIAALKKPDANYPNGMLGDGVAGLISESVLRAILNSHIGEAWNKTLQEAIQRESFKSASEAGAPGAALGSIADTLNKLATALLDPAKWLFILALLAGAGMVAFGGANVLRAAA